jgi:UDP-2-acetamido-3-amino-2,3-dideoxy-glucuronate N-acetyltransferase
MPILNSQTGKNFTAWYSVNIYDCVIGDNCKVGSYTEMGRVIVGNNVSIGAHSFLPEGIFIEDNVFIGPRFCGTNDTYPPSGKEKWGKIKIRKGARIGANVTILPNIEIGENALVGAGSVVTKNIPPGETWMGNPARESVSRRKTSPSSAAPGGGKFTPFLPSTTLKGDLWFGYQTKI